MTKGVVTLKGKKYATVALRVEEFRAAHNIDAGWGVQTDVQIVGDCVLARASIVDIEGRIVANGHALQKIGIKGKSAEATNPAEVAETSAVGRALAFAGYPGDADLSIASADEVLAAQRQRDEPPAEPLAIGQKTKILNLVGDLSDALGRDIPDHEAKAFDVASKKLGRLVEGWGQMSAADAAVIIDTLTNLLATANAKKEAAA